MISKIISFTLVLFLFVVAGATKLQAQDAHADSSFTKQNMGQRIINKLIVNKDVLEFDDVDKSHEGNGTDDKNEYGIGNVIGKKKSGKANKKTGKSVKVEINLTANKVIEYEIQVDKGKFSISRQLLTD